ncbi:IS110 family transposase [Paraburkholderia sp. RCC_158]|uniref:IS110 family transposase n=1 Tax=Paraburkholderia sp. RCC_158 TaxID=3239220 RepID=UPI003524FED8
MQELALVGIDLGKHTFHLHGQDASGRQVFRKKIGRSQVLAFCSRLPACTIAMEAGGGAHFMARQIALLGHQVKLISPRFVRPFVKSIKNDFMDAEAICEAASRPSMRFVTPKSESQQSLSALHRTRQSLMQERIRTGNQIHAFLLEFGIVMPRGTDIKKRLAAVLAEHDLPAPMMTLLLRLRDHSEYLRNQIMGIEKELSAQLSTDELAQRLLTVPGIGPITASALIGEMGDGLQFACGRDFAAWLGLVPQQISTGGKTTLRGVSRREGKPIRTLLVLCARSYILRVNKESGRLADWVRSLMARRHANIVACALANKLARIAWAVATKKAPFQPYPSVMPG